MPQVKNVSPLFGFEGPLNCTAFSEEVHPWVPEQDPAYVFNPGITRTIILALHHNKHMLLHGLHGTGKSSHIEQVAARLNWPCLRLNLDGYLTRADLLGRDVLTQGVQGNTVTRFQEGLLIWAIKNPVILILDEYDAARPELLFIFQQLLENAGKLAFFDEATLLKPHPYFRLFATSNTLGFGDEHGLYQGTQLLNQGHLDRWSLVLEMPFLAPEDEEKVILQRSPALNTKKERGNVASMVALATLTRQSFRQGNLSLFLSPRALFAWADLVPLFKDRRQAFEAAFLNRVPASDKPLIEELYQRVFGASREKASKTGNKAKFVGNS